ncbi:MAG TPA: ATP-binding protein [Gemmatimonadaceae bacterium]
MRRAAAPQGRRRCRDAAHPYPAWRRLPARRPVERRVMLNSVRARLTLWHTAVLAVLLGLFAAGAYLFVVRITRARTDAAVLDALSDLTSELAAEGAQQGTTRGAATDILRERRFRTSALAVFDCAGRTVASSLPRPRSAPGEDREPPLDMARLAAFAVAARGGAPRLVTVPDSEGGYRAAVVPLLLPDGCFVASAALSIHDEVETLDTARLALAAAIPVALLLSALGGWLLARRSLAPMIALRERAARIGATNLGERLPIANPADEVGRLATVFNALLARLERAFTQQRQFMADASHELRTPVAVVQHEVSLALSRSHRPAAEYEDALRVVRDAGRRLRRIVDDLFLLARADAGELRVHRGPLYLDEAIGSCVRELRSLAQRRGVSVRVEALPEAPFLGDEALLHRVVLNLLENAIKYAPPEASVSVRLLVEARGYRVEVEDTGSGIPAEAQPRIFERFFRADAARARDEGGPGGAGLGLAIARSIAEAHDGRLELARSGPTGSVFALTLPHAGEPA